MSSEQDKMLVHTRPKKAAKKNPAISPTISEQSAKCNKNFMTTKYNYVIM